MDDTKKVTSALLALVEQGQTARTKMGRFAELLPAINAAHASGVPHEKIVETLNQQGWNLKLTSYTTMLHRLRSGKVKKYAALAQDVPAVPAVQGTPGKEVSSAVKESPASARTENSDAPDQVQSDALETQSRREHKSRQYISDGSNGLLNILKKN